MPDRHCVSLEATTDEREQPEILMALYRALTAPSRIHALQTTTHSDDES
jgi:hypothetical protein